MVRKLTGSHTGMKTQMQNLEEFTMKLTSKYLESMRRRQD